MSSNIVSIRLNFMNYAPSELFSTDISSYIGYIHRIGLQVIF